MLFSVYVDNLIIFPLNPLSGAIIEMKMYLQLFRDVLMTHGNSKVIATLIRVCCFEIGN